MNGDPRKKVHKGKWEQVIQKATRSLQDLIRAASSRRRNIIIDQVGTTFLFVVNIALSYQFGLEYYGAVGGGDILKLIF